MSDPTRFFLPLEIVASGTTDIGTVRRHNEDAVLLRPDLDLYILADGAGGHNAGNVASALATTAIANFFEATKVGKEEEPDLDSFGLPIAARRLAAALQRANEDILEIAKTSNKLNGMGTTAVAISCFKKTGVMHVAHVGDSRCYRFRDGILEQLTHDHSLINDALEMRPNIDDKALAKLPHNVVTRALGMEPNVRVSVRSYRMLAGDKVLLCSDGLSDTLDDDLIGDIMATDRTPDETVRALIARANDLGAQDNIGVIIAQIKLAPDAVAVPTVPRYTPRRPASVPPPNAGARNEDPEIIILSVEHEGEPPQFHVVPAESADDEVIEALEDFSKNR